jgi:cyclopropane fatty-acyl-phospholipid synthase-like methyltransferase
MNFFNSAYKDIPPWDIGRPQKEFIRLAEDEEISGRVLDGITVNFLVFDALKLQSLQTKFNTVIDCGLFHVFTDEERPIFATSLSSALLPDGKYLMLCFSEHEPGSCGPRKVTQAEIRAAFRKGWKINYIREAEFETMFDAEGVKAWLSSITRL